ncbi:MAG TPA: hypothetical protein VEH09_14445 [Thermodesulfobacteriota bacterium]|nr:hypothetical protein [Thermodesulfobacteriota bacterium]
MQGEAIKKTIEELLRAPAELRNKLPRALKEVSEYGIGETLKENPDFLLRLLSCLRKADAARVFTQLSKEGDQISDLLWGGIDSQTERSQSMKSLLMKAERDIHVNIEASDSPFQCHFIVEKGKITGGCGLLPFKDEDFRFMGPTETLMGLFIGDLSLGFSNLQLQTAGHSGWMSRVGPIMREVSKLLKGN